VGNRITEVKTMRKPRTKLLFLSSLAVCLALAAVPTVSAASIFDIPLPTTCINGSSPGTCPDGRINASFSQGQASGLGIIGDVVYVPTSGPIDNLSMWVIAPTTVGLDDLSAYIGTLSLYMGNIGTDYSGSLSAQSLASTSAPVPDGYNTGTWPYQDYVSLYGPAAFNIYEITFNLATPFVAQACGGDPSAACFGWAVSSNSDTFSPLISFLDRPDTNIPYGGDTYGALTFFSGSPYSYNYTGDVGTITGFGLAPSVDFVTNPEPSTIGLLAIGMGLLGLKIRRRK